MQVVYAQQIERVSFIGVDVSLWAVTGIDTAIYAFGIGVPIPALVVGNAQFWIEKDSAGKDCFCTTRRIGAPLMTGHFLDPISPVQITATPFEMINNGDSTFSYMPKSQD